ncbi:uncharacterized protein ARMOST_16742 [Armillaria ostoyae]|uniref:Reverse transcriptase domain-containing protein n=1 Tax=Armillaria ostoyae TaxID=47428 RepID=A0A284RX27_ARMOS|nr:uncharacterized protein ARMOST_16742 [Armillaria ostoyae]
MSQPTTGATANPTGPTSTVNPKPGPKSAEDVALDKLRAKMNKDVAMRNAKRADRRKELTAQGKDPKDVSEDEKDESDILIHTVRKAVEAKVLSSSPVKAAATTTAPATSATTTATSMDATLSTVFSDAVTEKNKTAYNPNDIAFHEDYKALLVHKISIPLSMFHPTYLHAMQYSDDSLPRIKITRTGTDGASKNFSVLDISKAPAEADLARADFLVCYNNLLEFFTAIGCGPRTLQGLNEHLHAMLSDPNFAMWFEAYKAFDRDFRAKFFKDPFIPDPSTKFWSDGVQTAKDNYLLNQWEPQATGEQGQVRPSATVVVVLVPFGPYASDVVSLAIARTPAHPQHLAKAGGPFSSSGGTACSSASLITSSSVSASTSQSARSSLQPTMASTCAPYAPTLTMERRNALVTEAHKVVTPYKPAGWRHALQKYNLIDKYPNLIFDITHGSPIGNPPSLTSTFLPPNMPSAEENPEIIENYLQDEIAAGRMGEGMTIEEAFEFFGGHFRTAPLGVVFDQEKPRIIHNLSARDTGGSSTNSWLDAKDWPTRWYTASMYEEAVVQAPPGTQAAALDWVKAYRCSPVIFGHKRYIATLWKGRVYPDHCAPFGLTTSGGIQGCVADAFNDILNAAGIPGVFKWVDDHNILRSPIAQRTLDNGDVQYSYDFDLQTIFDISQPLGILWHDVSVKGHDFQYVTSYVGFMWDIAEKRVYLSEKKREKYLKKVSDFLLRRPSSVSYKEASSLHGTLQHVCFVCKAGKAYLPALSAFVAHFPNKWVAHHPSKTVWSDLEWWRDCLAQPSLSRSLMTRQCIILDIWVDASYWGIGLVVGNQWAAWRLKDGWHAEGRDIGWAESIAVEVAARYITSSTSVIDADFPLNSDNTSVIDTHKIGRSRNVHRNASLRRLSLLLAPRNLTLSPSYVESAVNLADPISRGELGPQEHRLDINFLLPEELTPWLDHV